jgi:predicted ATP-grasp superfamily ATP-dependent carboligase
MKSIIIVNPNRYTGYSYIVYAKKFLTEYNVVGLWTTNAIRMTCTSTAINYLDSVLIVEDMSYGQLLDTLAKFNPQCFLVGDDSAFNLADTLQHHFYPDHSNDITLYDKRTSKENYFQYLKQKNLINTNQYKVDIDNIPKLDFTKKYVMKPITGAGNENVFFVDSAETIRNIATQYQDDFIIQDFLEGEEYCIEILSHGGNHKCTMASIYKGHYLVNDLSPWRDENELVSPDDPNVIIIYDYLCEILNTLGVRLGMTWSQVKIHNGVPNLVEINFRSQGHGLFQMIHKATGSNYASEAYKAYLNNPILDMNNKMYKKIGNWNKICVNNLRERHVDSIPWHELDVLKSDIWKEQYADLSKQLTLTKNFKTTIGMVMIQNTDLDQYTADYTFIKNWKSGIEK